MRKIISSLIAAAMTMSIACLNTFAIDDSDINVDDDDTLMEDTTPDPYPPVADPEQVLFKNGLQKGEQK